MPTSDQPLPPSHSPIWQQALIACKRPGLQVVSLEDTGSLAILSRLVAERSEARESVLALAREWVAERHFTWIDTMVGETSTVPRVPDQRKENEDSSPSSLGFASIQALCDRVVNFAVVLGDSATGPSLDTWSYLVELAPPAPFGSVARLHNPALGTDIDAAAQVLPFPLPAAFTAFCQLTNGLDLDARGRTSINGIGPSRADWRAVVGGDWRVCERYHELAAQWQAFHGMYEDILAYEAEQTTELTPIVSERSRISGLAPIMLTTGGDYWCLGTEQARLATEECPVVYWDHEVRDLTQSWTYANYGEWVGAHLGVLT